MELNWRTSCPLSALHMAWVVASDRPLLDRAFQPQLAPIAQQLHQYASNLGWTSQTFWQHLLTRAGDQPNASQLVAELLVDDPSGSANPQIAAQFEQSLQACLRLVAERYPRMSEELALRVQPLQAAWEARGPGLMFQISEFTACIPATDAATVILVQPAAGGAGLAHSRAEHVHIEAVLTDIDHRIPETLRLAWLLSQSLQMHPTQLTQLALIPAVLAAAEEVQLSSLAHHTLELSLTHWLQWPSSELKSTSQSLYDWWQACASHTRDTWTSCLADLAKRLAAQ